MLVLAVAMVDLAIEISGLVPGARYVLNVESGKDLRHQIHDHQPDVVLLDWRLGGNLWRAIDEVPAIVERTTSHPYVIVLLPHTTQKVEEEAAERDCYDVISVNDADFPTCLRRSLYEAERARIAIPRSRRRCTTAGLH